MCTHMYTQTYTCTYVSRFLETRLPLEERERYYLQARVLEFNWFQESYAKKPTNLNPPHYYGIHRPICFSP